ncbi:MAG: RnfH family protein [Pseudomonadota bacterium]|nr:RnfH family protein [Pseudomonadota bacterium]MED5406203.1 RnfH family protein [Pseudomonadota bacterium]MEE3288690.1 RnfH family protein [Pseudomonadota bacterium]
MNDASLEVEVVYALPKQQFLVQLSLPLGSTAREAVEQSGLLVKFPQINLETLTVGIFSRVVGLDHVLVAGDRVEIYRPLLMSPGEARRRRAQLKPTR